MFLFSSFCQTVCSWRSRRANVLESLLQRTAVLGKFLLGAPQPTSSQLRQPPDNHVLVVHQIRRPPNSFHLSSRQNLTFSRRDSHPRPASPSPPAPWGAMGLGVLPRPPPPGWGQDDADTGCASRQPPRRVSTASPWGF